MRRVTCCAAIALATWACQGESTVAPSDSNFFISVAGAGEGARPPAGFDGTWIDIVPGVEFRQTLVMGTGTETQKETRINGHRFVVEGEFIVIGSERYGPLPRGTRVEVRNEGVFAEGRHLGALPERVATPTDGR